MSIILIQINKYGIICATDSNITSKNNCVLNAPKLFKIPKLKSVICISGIYNIKDKLISEILNELIFIEDDTYDNLESFVFQFKNKLEKEFCDNDTSDEFIAMAAGYNKKLLPELWCLSNTNLQADYNYSHGSKHFHYKEHFLTNSYHTQVLDPNLNRTHTFLQSTIEGRQQLNQKIVAGKKPRNLKDAVSIVTNNLKEIISLYEAKNNNIIGGEVKIFRIKSPKHINK